MTIPTRAEVSSWTSEERAEVARALDEVLERPAIAGRAGYLRRLVIISTLGGAVLMVPWVVGLSLTLPMTVSGGAWRTVWVGFDAALIAALGVTGWLAWRRRQVVLIGLLVSATLIYADAWFDVCLSWHTPEQTAALISAALFELPVATLLTAGAVMIIRRTSRTVALLRGRTGLPRSVWELALVITPPRYDIAEQSGADDSLGNREDRNQDHEYAEGGR